MPFKLKLGCDATDPFRVMVEYVDREGMVRTLVAIVGFDNHPKSQTKPGRIGGRCPVVDATTEHEQKPVTGRSRLA
jgi:hypothetical protein